VVCVTLDQEAALAVSDKIIVMKKGDIAQQGYMKITTMLITRFLSLNSAVVMVFNLRDWP
jgi:ABC-type Fe3+/spermidine/putrescine transport system ATPase subunit